MYKVNLNQFWSFLIRENNLNTCGVSWLIVPGSLSPRGRSFDECVDDMQRAEELRIVLNDAAASSSRNSSQGSGGGGWSSSDEEEADPMDQDEEGPLQKPTNILSCLAC